MSEREIYLHALYLTDPAERAAYLDDACVPDADLRRRIDALLDAHEAAGGFLRTPAPAVVAAGSTAEAIGMFEAVLPPMEATLGADCPQRPVARHKLAVDFRAVGRTPEAIRLLEANLNQHGLNLGPDQPERLKSTHGLGHALEASRSAEAEPLLRAALDWHRSQPAPSRARDRMTASLSLCLVKQAKWAEAEPVIRECLTLREATEPDAWSTFNTRSMLGHSLRGQVKFTEAEPLILSGYEGMKAREATIPPPGRTRLPEAAARVVRLYEDWGRPEEAAWWREMDSDDLPDPDDGFPEVPFARP